MDRPISPGVTYRGEAIPNEVVEARKLRVSSAATLRDLEDTYFCYTPALFYMFVRLNGIEPFVDFVQEYGQQVWPFSIKFDRPVFSGLNMGDEPYWNHVLYLMEREHGVDYVNWMMLNGFFDREHKVLSRIRYRNIWIADPLYLDKKALIQKRPPIVQIMVFCLETNRGNFYIQPGHDTAIDLPRLAVRSTVYKDTAAFAEAIWRNHPDPYSAAESAVTPQGEIPGLVDFEKEVSRRMRGPLRLPDPTRLEDLPEAHRAEILEAIQSMKRLRF